MDFEIQKQGGCCIFSFNCSELTVLHVDAIVCVAEKLGKGVKFALNFEGVKHVCSEFFEFMESSNRGGGVKRFSLFGLSQSMLAYFSLRKSTNLASIYLNSNDMLEGKRQMIKRDFRVV